MPSCAYESRWVNDDVRMFRATVRQFVQKEFVPAQDRWREQHGCDAMTREQRLERRRARGETDQTRSIDPGGQSTGAVDARGDADKVRYQK